MRKYIGTWRGILAESVVLLLLTAVLLTEKMQIFPWQSGDGKAETAMNGGMNGLSVINEENASGKAGTSDAENDTESDKTDDYIKWVEFNVTSEAMKQAYQYDVDTCTAEIHLDWVELLAILGAKYGGDFTRYDAKDMEAAAEALLSGERTIDQYREELTYCTYYEEAYRAVLGGMVGEYRIQEPAEENAAEQGASGETTQKVWKKYYGLKAFSPIAKGFPYSDYDDFGVSRSYGYQRNHLGHDMMAQVGTPVIAVESGEVTALG